MTRDRDRRSERDQDRSSTGDRKLGDDRRASDPSETDSPAEDERIAVDLVDDITSRRDTRDAVVESVAPSQSVIEQTSEDTVVQTRQDLRSEQVVDEITHRVTPRETVRTVTPEAITISIGPVEKTTQTITEPIELGSASETEGLVALTNAITSEHHREQVSRAVRPTAERETTAADEEKAKGEFEFEDEGLFGWGGGSPYGSRRPSLVLHRNTGDVPSLAFLQAVLRDTYRELVGGEPTADTVEFVANEPRIPEVQRSIVTLDLSGGEWESNIRNGRVGVERNGVDIVPKLREVAATLYTGELGYFVVNVPDEWEDPLRNQNFFERFVATLADIDDAEDETFTPESDSTSSLVEEARSSPILLAEPTETDRGPFFEQVLRYHGLALQGNTLIDVEQAESVGQVESIADRALRQNEWRRIAVTEQQQSGEESEEHYFWKAAIIDGLLQRLYESRIDEYERFGEFFDIEVLDDDGSVSIDTEWSPNGGSTSAGDSPPFVADIHIGGLGDWDVVADFHGSSVETVGRDPVVEFETGISEGAFNFRKFRKTLEKYEGAPVSFVALVIPPRLLYRGQRRTRMIQELVESWDEHNEVNADLFVPTLASGIVGQGTCRGLRSVGSSSDRSGETPASEERA